MYRNILKPFKYSINRFFCQAAKDAEVSIPTKQPFLKRSTQNLKNYLKLLLDDYMTVLKETSQDARNQPIKTSLIASVLTGLFVLGKTRPDEQHYYCSMVDSATDVWDVSELARNPVSADHVMSRVSEYSDYKLRFLNLGIVSLVYVHPHSSQCKEYSAVNQWTGIDPLYCWKTIVDVGVAGCWLHLNDVMKNYDVNPDEWEGVDDNAKQKIGYL